MPEPEKKIALVTGATGYLAAHVVQKLTERGYHVRGTCRSKDKAQNLLKVFPEIELFEADLLKEGSFDDAVKGAAYVFHTASPFPAKEVKDAQKELVDPAVKGTLNVLNSVAKDGNVKRVIITSSVAAVAGKRPEEHIYDEKDWNLDSTVDFEPYRYSKRVAEESAWKFCKEKGISMVSILPSFILGPPLTPTEATSILKVKAFFDGKFDQTAFGVVDVRDVAEVHLQAAEQPDANGRYMATSSTAISNFELSQAIKHSGKFDQYNLPTTNIYPLSYRNLFSCTRVTKELGVELRSYKDSLIDMCNALIDLGIVEKK